MQHTIRTRRLPIQNRAKRTAYQLTLGLIVLPSVFISAAATAGAVLFGLQAFAGFLSLPLIITCFLLTTLLWCAVFGQAAIEALHSSFTDPASQQLLNHLHKQLAHHNGDIEQLKHWRAQQLTYLALTHLRERIQPALRSATDLPTVDTAMQAMVDDPSNQQSVYDDLRSWLIGTADSVSIKMLHTELADPRQLVDLINTKRLETEHTLAQLIAQQSNIPNKADRWQQLISCKNVLMLAWLSNQSVERRQQTLQDCQTVARTLPQAVARSLNNFWIAGMPNTLATQFTNAYQHNQALDAISNNDPHQLYQLKLQEFPARLNHEQKPLLARSAMGGCQGGAARKRALDTQSGGNSRHFIDGDNYNHLKSQSFYRWEFLLKLEKRLATHNHWLLSVAAPFAELISWGVALIAEGAGVAFGGIAIIHLLKRGVMLSPSQTLWLAIALFIVGVTTMVCLNRATIATTLNKTARQALLPQQRRFTWTQGFQTACVVLTTGVVASFYFLAGKRTLPDLASLLGQPALALHSHLNALLGWSSLAFMLIGNCAFYAYFIRQHNKTPYSGWGWRRMLGYALLVGVPTVTSLASFLYFMQADSSVAITLFHSHTAALILIGLITLPALYMFVLLFKGNGEILTSLATDLTSRQTALELFEIRPAAAPAHYSAPELGDKPDSAPALGGSSG